MAFVVDAELAPGTILRERRSLCQAAGLGLALPVVMCFATPGVEYIIALVSRGVLNNLQ